MTDETWQVENGKSSLGFTLTLPSAFSLLPSAFCLLPSAFCFLPSAFCLLLSAFSALRSDVVIPDLAVKRGGVHPEEFGGARLMAAGYFQRAPDQLYLESIYFVIERNPAR